MTGDVGDIITLNGLHLRKPMSTAGEELFWHNMMSAEMEVNHGVALLGAWRAVKYLPDVIDHLIDSIF